MKKQLTAVSAYTAAEICCFATGSEAVLDIPSVVYFPMREAVPMDGIVNRLYQVLLQSLYVSEYISYIRTKGHDAREKWF